MNKYGPNSPQVELFIERLKVMTAEEVKTLIERLAVQDAARNDPWVAWAVPWVATRYAAWVAWVAAYDATWDAAWDAWDAARYAGRVAQAIVVMDLITAEQFAILTEPFAEILIELGIVWEGK
jgi:hypothetical protein